MKRTLEEERTRDDKQVNWMLIFTLIGGILITIYYQCNDTPETGFVSQHCIVQKLVISDESVKTSISSDSILLVEVERNYYNMRKKAYLCELNKTDLVIVKDGKLHFKNSENYYLENRGNIVVLEYRFTEPSNFDLITKNLDSAFLELKVAK